MWSKVLTQLVPELVDMLPHVRRVIPMADKFLAAKSASDAAIVAMAEGVHEEVAALRGELAKAYGELGKVYIVNSAVNQKLDALTDELKSTAVAADQTRAVTTALGHTIVVLERQVRTLRSILVAVVVLVVVLILMCGWILLAQPHP